METQRIKRLYKMEMEMQMQGDDEGVWKLMLDGERGGWASEFI